MTRRAEKDRRAALDLYIQRIVAQSPPLSPEQIDRIGALLRPTRGGM